VSTIPSPLTPPPFRYLFTLPPPPPPRLTRPRYAQKVLAGHHRQAMILPRIHYAFNLSACNVSFPIPNATLLASTADGLAHAAAVAQSGHAATTTTTTEIYVSATGHDSTGDGSKTNPFQSITRAQQAVRAARSKEGKDGGAVLVWLRSGVYYQSTGTPFTLTPADSGSSALTPVTYASLRLCWMSVLPRGTILRRITCIVSFAAGCSILRSCPYLAATPFCADVLT
jgi:hypothetical protein